MKTSKIIVSSAITLVTLIAFYVLYTSQWSAYAKKGKENILKSKKVNFQMNQESILTVMGKPDTIINERFCYTTNNDSYPYIEFSFDSLGRVQKIYSPSN